MWFHAYFRADEVRSSECGSFEFQTIAWLQIVLLLSMPASPLAVASLRHGKPKGGECAGPLLWTYFHSRRYFPEIVFEDKARQDETRRHKTRRDETRQDKTKQNKTRYNKTRQDKTGIISYPLEACVFATLSSYYLLNPFF